MGLCLGTCAVEAPKPHSVFKPQWRTLLELDPGTPHVAKTKLDGWKPGWGPWMA